MFRRRWSGLPEDPDFPVDLEKLGYFIQPETDEIRSRANPKFYFKYFLTKNDRHNDRQRFAFNLAVQDIVHARLEAIGLAKIPLPAPAAPSTKPADDDGKQQQQQDHRHVPIFVSENLHKADRVVVLFGEGSQELGVLAHRVIGGQGGVDQGSVVSLAKDLLSLPSASAPSSSSSYQDDDGGEKAAATARPSAGTGVVLANTGERWWWPQGGRPLSLRASMGVKMKSCVHRVGSFDPLVNLVPGSEDVEAHVRSIFERVLDSSSSSSTHDEEKNKKKEGDESVGFVANPGARIQVIAVGDAAAAVETYLDQNWGRWEGRLDCLAMLGDGKPVYELESPGFKKFLREKARIYITTQAPLGTPLSNPEGNLRTMNFTSYGCPVLSSGEPYYVELTLIKAKQAVLAFLADTYTYQGQAQETAAAADLRDDNDEGGGGGGGVKSRSKYVNPVFEITYTEEDIPEETPAWGASEQPGVGMGMGMESSEIP